MSVISKLKVWIGSDTSDLQKGLKKSKKEVSAFGTGIKKLKGMIAGAFAVSSIVLTSSLRTPKFFVKEFSYFLMPCHQHGLRINLLVQR